MPSQEIQTHQLFPGQKQRFVAGNYNVKTGQPHYKLDINGPDHVRNQVIVNQILIGDSNNCQYAWDVHNRSAWLVFVTVKRTS